MTLHAFESCALTVQSFRETIHCMLGMYEHCMLYKRKKSEMWNTKLYAKGFEASTAIATDGAAGALDEAAGALSSSG